MYKKCEEILNKLESEGKIKISDYQFPPKQELKLKLKDMLEDEVDEKYYLSEKLIKCLMSEKKYGNYVRKHQFLNNINRDVATVLTAASQVRASDTFIVKDTENYIEWNEKGKLDVDCRAYKEDKISGTIMTTPKNKVLLKEELCNQLIKNGKVKEFDVIRHSYSNSRMKDWENRNIEKHNEVPTLDTRCDCLEVAVNQPPLRIRKLTPKECWRLMGFDDEDFEKASKVNSNTQLYKQAGNSICVPVLMAIFKELIK